MKNLFKALIEFQNEVPVIHQDTQGYGYTYANLSTIFKTINPLLKKHDLGFTQLIQGKQIETIIYHAPSGETISSLIDIPQDVTLKGMNTFQVMGSAITYMKRYALSSALGLVTDKDIDGAGEEDNKPTDSQLADILICDNIDTVRKFITKFDLTPEDEKLIIRHGKSLKDANK